MRALIHALCCSDRRSQGPFTSESLALHMFTFHSSKYVICCHTLMYSAKQPPRNVVILACVLCGRSLASPQQTCTLMHVVDASAASCQSRQNVHDHILMHMRASLKKRSAVLQCLFQAISTRVHQVAHLPSHQSLLLAICTQLPGLARPHT